MEMELCSVWREFKWMVQKKGLEVMCSTGTRAWEYRVGGYCIGSAIYGLDSFPLLAPSHIDYSKVDPGLSDSPEHKEAPLQSQEFWKSRDIVLVQMLSLLCT